MDSQADDNEGKHEFLNTFSSFCCTVGFDINCREKKQQSLEIGASMNHV